MSTDRPGIKNNIMIKIMIGRLSESNKTARTRYLPKCGDNVNNDLFTRRYVKMGGLLWRASELGHNEGRA